MYSPLYRRGDQGMGKLSNLLKVTQLVSHRFRI